VKKKEQYQRIVLFLPWEFLFRPYRFAGREAMLQIIGGKFKVIVGGEEVCEHEIIAGRARYQGSKNTSKDY